MSSNDAAYMQRLLAKVMALAESKRSRTFVIPSDDSDLRRCCHGNWLVSAAGGE